MNKKKRHNRVVMQRIFAFVLTILTVVLIGLGAYFGIDYVLHKTDIFAKKPSVTEDVTETPSEAPSENGDIWIKKEKEKIDDGYADVDTSVLSENEVSENVVTDEADGADEEIENIVASLALEEKVAQLFIVTPEQITGMDVVTRAGETTQNALSEYPVGGLIYFAQNFEDPDQTKEMLGNTKSYIENTCGLTPFLATDEEGGRVTRIASNESFGVDKVASMSTIGKTKDPEKAYEAGETIGKYMSDLGFNLDLAPVADVLTDSKSEVIGDRSFGSDPELVSELSWQYASGLQDNGITACFKHFPGHGSVAGDTHASTVSQDKSREDLYSSDLIPFQNAVTSGARMIMASHISCPEITGDDVPASLSPVMLTGILREDLGYEGVIITDAFNMAAVTDLYQDPGEAAVTAINAGADIILMPADFHEAYNAVLSAASSGKIETERIDDSLRRILKIKLGRY
jgi:beta-N-acetylhexosaminidase